MLVPFFKQIITNIDPSMKGGYAHRSALCPLTPSCTPSCIHSNLFHSSNISSERNYNLIHYNNYIIYNY